MSAVQVAEERPGPQIEYKPPDNKGVISATLEQQKEVDFWVVQFYMGDEKVVEMGDYQFEDTRGELHALTFTHFEVVRNLIDMGRLPKELVHIKVKVGHRLPTQAAEENYIKDYNIPISAAIRAAVPDTFVVQGPEGQIIMQKPMVSTYGPFVFSSIHCSADCDFVLTMVNEGRETMTQANNKVFSVFISTPLVLDHTEVRVRLDLGLGGLKQVWKIYPGHHKNPVNLAYAHPAQRPFLPPLQPSPPGAQLSTRSPTRHNWSRPSRWRRF